MELFCKNHFIMLFKFSIIFTVESFSPPSPTIGHLKERGTLLRNIVCTCVSHWTTCSIMQMFNLHLCKKKKLWIFFHIFVIFFLNCNSTFLLFFFIVIFQGILKVSYIGTANEKKKKKSKYVYRATSLFSSYGDGSSRFGY